MKWICVFLISVIFCFPLFGQNDNTQRSTLYFLQGTSGANIREFNAMLAEKGISPLRNGYNSFGVGYQNRFNDFVLGFELYQNNGPKSDFRDYRIDYRSTRLYMNVGYSLTEEGRFHFIHYMSLGVGYLNFEMLKDLGDIHLADFLTQPAQGFVLRKNNIHKGSHYFGSFLTEIGFQLGYDFVIPRMEETIEIIAKFGYSFSPFENAWNKNGLVFDNIQSGAFLRLGAGISVPDHNIFYRDANLGVHLFYGLHFNKPEELNNFLESHGYKGMNSNPHNLGIKILGENRRRLYGIDFLNVANKGEANEAYTQTLNSIRVYANYGYKLFHRRNLELGVLGGLGFGNIRYTLEHKSKPDFPRLFEEPDFDGYLKSHGLMAKPELFVAYAMPLSKIRVFDMIYSVHAGYELPLGNYRLANMNMAKYIGGPYVLFGVGIRP